MEANRHEEVNIHEGLTQPLMDATFSGSMCALPPKMQVKPTATQQANGPAAAIGQVNLLL